MAKGKPWTKKEVEKLCKLLEAKEPLEVIAAELHRTRDAVKKKCKRLGLEVVGAKGYRTTTSLKLPKELPSVEEALKILAGTLVTLRIKWDLNLPWDLVQVREGNVCTLCFMKFLRLRRRLQRVRLEGAIGAKAAKLGLEVVKKTPRQFSTTSLKLPKQL